MNAAKRGGSAGASEASNDFPIERNDPGRGGSFGLQAVMEMQKTLGTLCERIDGLVESRKEDRAGYQRDTDKIAKAIQDGADKSEKIFKDFVKDEFRPLQNDVMKLRLKWAWVTGIAAVVGVLASVLIDLAKKKLGLG